MNVPILYLIDSLRNTDHYIFQIFSFGGCYQFHLFLAKLYPGCIPCTNLKGDHIVTLYQDKYYDISGVVHGDFYPINYEIREFVNSWSFHKNQMLTLTVCPHCETPVCTT
jgi:hypothetical protein